MPLVPWVEGMPAFHGGLPLAGLVYLGIGPTAVATLLLVRVVRSARPTFPTQTTYQVPVWSWFSARCFWEKRCRRNFWALWP